MLVKRIDLFQGNFKGYVQQDNFQNTSVFARMSETEIRGDFFPVLTYLNMNFSCVQANINSTVEQKWGGDWNNVGNFYGNSYFLMFWHCNSVILTCISKRNFQF